MKQRNTKQSSVIQRLHECGWALYEFQPDDAYSHPLTRISNGEIKRGVNYAVLPDASSPDDVLHASLHAFATNQFPWIENDGDKFPLQFILFRKYNFSVQGGHSECSYATTLTYNDFKEMHVTPYDKEKNPDALYEYQSRSKKLVLVPTLRTRDIQELETYQRNYKN